MRFVLSVTLLLFIALPLHAENWPHWRGPYFNGSTTETNLPTKWSRTEGIAWSVKLDGCAASTPIIWQDRVFLSGIDAPSDGLQTMCFDRTDGKLLWNRALIPALRRLGSGVSRRLHAQPSRRAASRASAA